MYIGKERRVSTIADRRVKTPMARWFGRRAGFDKNYRQGMLYVADRRAKTIDDLTEGCPIEPPNPSDTAELLKKYRAALILAYEIGLAVRSVYGIVPPKIEFRESGQPATIGLTVN